MPQWTIAILIILNTPVYYTLYRLIFRDFEDFTNAVWFWFKWDTWSLFDGTFFEDFWAEMKLSALFGLSAAIVYLEWSLLNAAFAPTIAS